MNASILKEKALNVLNGSTYATTQDAADLAEFALQIAEILEEDSDADTRTIYVGQKGFALVDRLQYDSMRVRLRELEDKIGRQRRIIDNLTSVRQR
jgi:hypothetical protein